MSLYIVPGYGGGALTVNESPLSIGFSFPSAKSAES